MSTRIKRIEWLLVCLFVASCGDSSNGNDASVRDASPDVIVYGPDADGDGITDVDENAPLFDHDGDSTPDYLDVDSDNDGVPDELERVGVPGSRPVDSDNDGAPDFRDLDSDANDIPDSAEGGTDLDEDRIPNSADMDNDGDFASDVFEIGPTASAPIDFDDDGTPDYLDFDSDNDTISDRDEYSPSNADTDMDGMPDRYDADSDNDTLTDAMEAGDADYRTTARDLDGDGTPDFRDPDADGDGLADREEVRLGTNPFSADTDGDDVSDLVEIGACPVGDTSCANDVTNASSSPRTRGNFVFVMPFGEPGDPERDTLQFQTRLQKADVYFLMDNTQSMTETVSGLKATVRSIVTTTRGVIPDAWFGVGGFDDYPFYDSFVGYGDTRGPAPSRTDDPMVDDANIDHDVPFFQYTTMTSDVDAVARAVGYYQVNNGLDRPESGVSALYALSARSTLGGTTRFATSSETAPTTSPPTCTDGRLGAACFRKDAVPIIVVMTDTDQHDSPTCSGSFSPAEPDCAYDDNLFLGGSLYSPPTYAQAVDALETLNARVVGISTRATSVLNPARRFLERAVQDTTLSRGVGGSASEYVIDVPGGSGSSALSDAVAAAIAKAAAIPLDVSARAVDAEGDAVNAVTSFIEHVEARTATAAGRVCTVGLSTYDRPALDADSVPDTFSNVRPGDPVCFDIVTRINSTVPATNAPQLFRAKVQVVGDGFTPLDTRDIYFVVPPLVRVEGPLG
jgi:hypothetical protein